MVESSRGCALLRFVARDHFSLLGVSPARAVLTPGLDISHYQGTINWTQLAADPQGYKFVFMKATEDTNYTDPTFTTNLAGAKSVGIMAGPYHFCRSIRQRRSGQQTPWARQLLPLQDQIEVSNGHVFAASRGYRNLADGLNHRRTQNTHHHLDQLVLRYDLRLARRPANRLHERIESKFAITLRQCQHRNRCGSPRGTRPAPLRRHRTPESARGAHRSSGSGAMTPRLIRRWHDRRLPSRRAHRPRRIQRHGRTNPNDAPRQRSKAKPGDFNRDGKVNAADYSFWKSANGTTVPLYTGADANGDTKVDAKDLAIWTAAVPEPTSAVLFSIAFAVCGLNTYRGRRRN